ncbi:single-stranded-DNA-specific exonuclease RecJ [Neofamilia massiliensis]|uniref:single-stranded-DNA-specific exonuclease RecJ n=1 Tax=Neofamilia massiliensis TaxID=1673724 RepID=UPI0006BB92EE|nr:single-stranded-DNA-specific exonuclease RecJ [Neofamilia massiliensis]
MEKWLIKSANSNIASLGQSPNEKILYRIIANRGIENEADLEEFLNPSLTRLNDPSLMKDLELGIDILLHAIDQEKKIRIIGDYDVDGIMSTYILYKFISKENPKTDYHLPHRIEDGYGINASMVDKASADGVDLIITCDNGVSAFDALERAREKNIETIVLDHHEPKIENGIQVLPPATALINPKQEACPYPFKGLCGAAISYKFIEYLAGVLGYEEGEVVRDYLEYAAIATVCDVMDLVGENRIIVANGLKLLNNTTNIGLKCLIKASGLEEKTLEPYHLGFIIGPLFNASGRLDSATIGLDLLLAENLNDAIELARRLQELNQERTKLTQEALELFIRDIESNKYYENDIIVSYLAGVHQSIAGIVAGRIKEKYNKPTIILTDGDDNIIKGSARSIDEYHITDGIAREKDLLLSFGGHKLAAGLSLKKKDLEEFRKRINDHSTLKEEDFYRKVMIDLGLPLSFINFDLINLLDKIGPYGNENPRPIFGGKDLSLGNFKILGKNKNVLKMTVKEGDTSLDGIMFTRLDEFESALEEKGYSLARLLVNGADVKADIVYSANINEWGSNKTLQLQIKNFRIKAGE